MLQLLYPQERDTVSVVKEDWWAPGPAWTEMENLTPTGVWDLDQGKKILWNYIGDGKQMTGLELQNTMRLVVRVIDDLCKHI